MFRRHIWMGNRLKQQPCGLAANLVNAIVNRRHGLGYHDSLGTFLTYIYQQGFLEDKFGHNYER